MFTRPIKEYVKLPAVVLLTSKFDLICGHKSLRILHSCSKRHTNIN